MCVRVYINISFTYNYHTFDAILSIRMALTNYSTHILTLHAAVASNNLESKFVFTLYVWEGLYAYEYELLYLPVSVVDIYGTV